MTVFGIVQGLGLRSRLWIGAGPYGGAREASTRSSASSSTRTPSSHVASPTARPEVPGRAWTAAGLCGLELATASARRLSRPLRLPSAHQLTSVGSAHGRDVIPVGLLVAR